MRGSTLIRSRWAEIQPGRANHQMEAASSRSRPHEASFSRDGPAPRATAGSWPRSPHWLPRLLRDSAQAPGTRPRQYRPRASLCGSLACFDLLLMDFPITASCPQVATLLWAMLRRWQGWETTLAFSRCPLRYSQAIAAVRFLICRALWWEL